VCCKAGCSPPQEGFEENQPVWNKSHFKLDQKKDFLGPYVCQHASQTLLCQQPAHRAAGRGLP
jgi:hypothetical protein